jgi:Lsr2
MATRTTVSLVDDLDGTAGDVETTRFALDGVSYLIDLNADNNRALVRALQPYMAAARRVGPKARKSSTSNPGKIREWARRQGYTLPDRGRLPVKVTAAYASAAGTP